mmetsp:Transcript_2987/g.6995  ORF Transcript_2987/g.6995 Transcript_2987/m.6995 type:complete len:516 (-) Transcript_2987:223-1770(-)
MEAGRKRKIETRGEVAAEEENKKKQQTQLGRVHCNYCKRNVSDQIYIKSADLEDVDLCLECFSVGVEMNDVKRTDNKNPHKNDCRYKVMERLDFPIISEDWTAREELALVEGIETFGIGNWVDVATVVGTKSKPECEFHYYAHYINTANGVPVPDVSRAVSKTKFINKEGGEKEKEDFTECVEAAVAGAGKVPGKLTVSEWKKEMIATKNVTRENIRYYDDKPAGCDVVGYMPARGDFDVEWDNDAEALICDCVFDDKKDTEQDRELKAKILEVYNWKLDERGRRKAFLLERGLLDFKRHQAQERRRSKEERDLWGQMRPFARFWPQEEHEEYVRSLNDQRKIRRRIEQLQHFRKVGLRSDAEMEVYEKDRRKREQDEKAKKSKHETSSYLAPKAGTQRSERHRNRGDDDAEADAPVPALGGVKESKKQLVFEVSLLPGSEMLSKAENHLCAVLRTPPLDYIAAKDAIFRESFRHGYLQAERAKQVCKLAPEKALKVYESMVSSGWVRPNKDAVI